MTPDVFASHTLSLVLSWIVGIGLLSAAVNTIVVGDFGEEMRSRRMFGLWIVATALVFSPARYMLFQVLVAEAYLFQGIRPFITGGLLAIPFGFWIGVLAGIGLYLPWLLLVAFTGKAEPLSRPRVLLASAAAPMVFCLSRRVFFWILPYMAYPLHILPVEDMVRATNGPAEVYFDYIVDLPVPGTPWPGTVVAGDTNKERLGGHLAKVYFGTKQRRVYEEELTFEHLRRSLEYVRQLDELGMSLEGRTVIERMELAMEARELLKKAKEQAGQVKVEALNRRFAGLGDAYSEYFVAGVDLNLQGLAFVDSETLGEGHQRLNHGDGERAKLQASQRRHTPPSTVDSYTFEASISGRHPHFN